MSDFIYCIILIHGIVNQDWLCNIYNLCAMCIIAAFIPFLKKQFPHRQSYTVIHQTYCISGHAASPKQMASAGAWQGVERRGAYCNCQARSLESRSFLLHWSQSPYTCSPLPHFQTPVVRQTERFEEDVKKGNYFPQRLSPNFQLEVKTDPRPLRPKNFFRLSALNTETVDAWQIWWGHSITAGHLPTHAGLWLWALGLPKVRGENTVHDKVCCLLEWISHVRLAR